MQPFEEEDGEAVEVSEEDTVTPVQHRRSSSITSPPPLPPSDFNPPADLPPPVPDAVSPPGSILSSASSSTWHVPSRPATAEDLLAQATELLVRPQLQALQRLSNDSIPVAASTASSAGSGASESGDHLAEAREKLLSDSLPRSRSGSATGSAGNSSPVSFDFNVTNPLPLRSAEIAEDLGGRPEPIRRGSSGSASSETGASDLPAERAWDSVWPAPGSAPRAPPIDNGPSRFPITPISPFITPSFSSAMITPRRPSSPASRDSPSPTNRRNHAGSPGLSGPARISPQHRSPGPDMPPDMFSPVRRGSHNAIMAHSPPSSNLISLGMNRHHRSQSNTSPSSSYFPERVNRTPPLSPPRSPSRGAVAIPTRRDDAGGSRPVWKHQNTPLHTASSPPSPPVIDSLNGFRLGRPRGKFMDTERPSFMLLPEAGPSIFGKPSPLSHQSSDGISVVTQGTSPSSSTEAPVPGESADVPRYLPPIALPPAVAAAPLLSIPGDDSSPVSAPQSPPVASSPAFAPSARPTALRRALSEHDARKKPPSLHRTFSITTGLDKSPKRTPDSMNLVSPDFPGPDVDGDFARTKKSPRRSPSALPGAGLLSSMSTSEARPSIENDERPRPVPSLNPSDVRASWQADPDTEMSDHVGGVDLVDEGDVLPNVGFQMDVTFDDEGLSTLERIFLLSKSDFSFHRAYVARVLGDLLVDVDPCESVEYVLPLLSGFSIDEDENVKESFASELHRVLWYYFSTCRLVSEDVDMNVGDSRKETVTVTSQGFEVVPTPTEEEVAAVPAMNFPIAAEILDRRRGSVFSATGPSSAGSSMTQKTTSSAFVTSGSGGTPLSTVSDTPSTASTAYSPGPFVNPYADDANPDKGWAKDIGPLVDRPVLAVNFFTPLLGALLLNQNPTISDSVRTCIAKLIGRLRRKVSPEPDVWGRGTDQPEPDERRTFPAQTGPHAYDVRPFDDRSREMVEWELLNGIVVGMGQLATEMPDTLMDSSESAQQMDDNYAQQAESSELFQEQLVAEATAGRATSMNLIGSLCELYTGEEVVERGFLDEVLRSCDGDVPVRAEGAVALSCLAKIAPADQVLDLIPLFDALIADETYQVRQSVCLSLPALCRRIPDKPFQRDFAVRSLLALTQSGDDVRCAALEVLGELIYVFDDDPLGPPLELLRVYMDDEREPEVLDGDWDIVASFNFPGICLTLGPARWHELRDLYARLQRRAGDKVMRTLAASVHELAKILLPDQIETDLLPVYRRCLACSEETRERIYEHVDVLISRLDKPVGWAVFCDLARAWKDGTLGGWRARELFARHIPSLFEMFKGVEGSEEILVMMQAALLDPFSAVRDAATLSVPQSYTVLEAESALAKQFRDTLLSLGSSRSYRQRMTFVRCLREFCKPPPNQATFEEIFVPALPRLAEDVVDVRLALARSVANLFVVGAYYGSQTGSIPSTLMSLAAVLRDDSSADVRDAIRNVNFDNFGKGKEVPHQITPPGPGPDASPPGVSGDAEKADDNGRYLPVRRPSAEVAMRMGSMRLATARGSEGSEETPKCQDGPSQGVNGLDPFSVSFARASLPENETGMR